VLVAAAALAVAGTAGDSAKTASGWLGVLTDNLSEPMLTALNIDHGVLVTDVTAESPAAKAGLQAGDVIVSLDGQKTGDVSDLRLAVRARPDKKVVIAIRRRGKDKKLTATLETRELGEHTLNFQWPAMPEQAVREARRALSNLGPDIKKGLERYDGTLDSLREQVMELRRELDSLRVEVQKRAKR